MPGGTTARPGTCSSGSQASSTSSGKPVEGGNLTFLIQGYDSGFVSSKSAISSYEGNLWGEITDKLVYVDAKGKTSPWIATSWDQSDDAKHFTLPTLGYHGSILLSPKTLALPVDQQADLSKEIGSGPFTVKSVKEGEEYVLAKRKDYDWGPAALGHTGAPYLDTLTYKVIKDESVRTQAVVAGQADVSFN
ncbi:ABC transporter substrate-binding protein, partial [Bacillus sp. S34]|nr:ABC transporter substrate-binding protein [Bacillus sp. S34]